MTIPNKLAREFREFPATSWICVSWIVVFAAMTCAQLASGEALPPTRWLVFGFGGGERFGDLTLANLERGQVWRLVTCNFIHYSLVHVALNALAMYQLGSIVESWYGWHQLLFIYGLTGVGGNLLSALGRWWTRSGVVVHSAGGSVVIMGLVGLCAVAGWRSRTPDGRWLAKVMLGFTLSTAALGWRFPSFIDNWGHAGGFVVGVAVGLSDRWFRAAVTKPSAYGAGVLTLLLIVGAAGVQFVVDRHEWPSQREQTLEKRAQYLVWASAELKKLRMSADTRSDADLVERWLENLEPWLDAPARAEVRAFRPLVREAAQSPLEDSRRPELAGRVDRMLAALRRNYEIIRRRLAQMKESR
ncbi:MAG: rhomboid family intramembrane serine protease [Isosphaeraceae bacterium]